MGTSATDRPKFFTRLPMPVAVGAGLDRATGLVSHSSAAPFDTRNLYAQSAKMSLRPGLAGTGFPPLAWGTDILAIYGVKASLEVLFAVYDRGSRQVRIYRLDTVNGILQTISSPANGLWGTISGTDFPVVTVGEADGFVFFAHDEADLATRLVTIYYTPNFADPSQPGTLTQLMADLNSDGVSAPVYFRGVVAYLVYMMGWGFGTEDVNQQDSPNTLRFSSPGAATTFLPENYFQAGVKRDPIVGCAPTSAQVNTVSGVSANSVLVVAKSDESYRIVGTNPDDFGIELLDSQYGTVSSRAIVAVGSTAYMWASDGPRAITPTTTQPIGQPLELLSPLPADFPSLGPAREAFAVYDPLRYYVEFLFPNLDAASVPVPSFVLSLWNPDDPRWTFFTREQPVSCGGELLFRDTGTGGVPPTGYPSGLDLEDDGLAGNPLYRKVRVAWINNGADGDELVQLFGKPTGGSWGVVGTFAVVLGDQVGEWNTALPVDHYDVAMRYIRGGAPAVGYESSNPDLWTAATAPDSKSTVTTSAEPVTWIGGMFTNAATPVTLSWASNQIACPFLLEKSTDGGATWATVVADLFATNYAYAIPAPELGTTVKFRVTAQRGAVVGPTAGVLDVPMFIVVAQPTWISGVYNPGSGIAALSWNAATNALTYLLEKSLNGGVSWATVATVSATSFNYTVPAPEVNTTVDFRLTGQNGATSSVPSATLPVVMTFNVGAGVMTGAAFTILFDYGSGFPRYGSVAVSWAGAVSADQYTLERQVNGGGYVTIKVTSSLGYTDSNFPSGNLNVNVDYRVTPRNTTYGVNGATSAPDTVFTAYVPDETITAASAVPHPPSSQDITVTWNPDATGLVYFFAAAGGFYTLFSMTSGAPATAFTVLPPGTPCLAVATRPAGGGSPSLPFSFVPA